MIVVNGQQISQATFDGLLQEYFSGTYTANKQPVPKKGSAEYTAAVQKVVQYLVQKSELEQQAKKRRDRRHREGHRQRGQEGRPPVLRR